MREDMTNAQRRRLRAENCISLAWFAVSAFLSGLYLDLAAVPAMAPGASLAWVCRTIGVVSAIFVGVGLMAWAAYTVIKSSGRWGWEKK